MLQVALDLEELVKAVDIASKITLATKCQYIWLEAGTPLIKAWGKLAVKALKELTNCYLVADTKTMDVPRLEAKIMFDAGADSFTVLGVTDDETLREALEVKKQTGKKIIIDLIGHKEPYKRAIEVARYEPDLIYFHIGISVQRARGLTAEELVKEAVRTKNETGIRVGVAGGLRHGQIKNIVSQGIDVVVVGSAITQAKDPAEATVNIIKEMGYTL